MKNCPKCGVELADDVTFCTECGEQLEVVEAAPEAAPVEAPKQSKISLILGIASLVMTFLPILTYIAPIVAIVGLVFGIKEVKAGGKKVGLILSIVALAIFAVSIILGIILGIIIGIGAGAAGLDMFELFEEILWELGLY